MPHLLPSYLLGRISLGIWLQERVLLKVVGFKKLSPSPSPEKYQLKLRKDRLFHFAINHSKDASNSGKHLPGVQEAKIISAPAPLGQKLQLLHQAVGCPAPAYEVSLSFHDYKENLVTSDTKSKGPQFIKWLLV